jgi:hypothetical protein
LSVVREEANANELLPDLVNRLVRRFKVSSLVVLQRLRDVRLLTWAQFDAAYNAELERLSQLPSGSGGDFYLTAVSRYSRRFTRALVESTLEGNTLYKDAFRLLGISKSETLHTLGENLVFGS